MYFVERNIFTLLLIQSDCLKPMKHLTIIFFLCFLFCAGVAVGQIRQGKGKVNNESFYYSYIEPAQPVKGILLLLPGWGESTQSIYEKTKLPALLLEKGFVTAVPQLHQTLFADDYTISELNEIIKQLLQQYNSNNPNLIIGGLSAGGSIAIGYAEHILDTGTGSRLKAVFAIDPPLDLARIYTSSENKIKYSCKSKLIKKEGSFMKNYLLRSFNGSPQEKPDAYAKYSAFAANEPDGGNAKLLKNIPVRLYSEPDLEFVRKKYCNQLQYEDINAVDLEKLNRFLKSTGNEKCEYITTTGKGFHSWNILDPADCVQWILQATATDSNSLDGSWIPIRQEIGGKELPAVVFQTQKLIINDTTYLFTAESVDKGSLVYKNGQMDIYGKEGVNKGKHFTAIYKLDNDQLTICYNLKGDSYPADFETKSKPTLFLSVFRKD